MKKAAGIFLALGITALPVMAASEAKLNHYDRQIVASCLVLEAASEGVNGMKAVLNVIYNRAGHNIEAVVPVTVRKGQFASMRSIWEKARPDYSPLLSRAQRDRMYPKAVRLVLTMERGKLRDNTYGATHFYQMEYPEPYWTRDMDYLLTIGKHRFYREQDYPSLAYNEG